MNRDMKSNDLEEQIRASRVHVRSSSWQLAIKRVTTQHVNAYSQTESAIAQKNGHEFVACLRVLSTGSLADFQSPKVDGMMLRA